MKKLAFTAQLLVALVAMFAVSCSPKGDDKVAISQAVTDVLASEPKALNIRYIDSDSLMAGYTLAKEIAEYNQKVMLDYQRQGVQRQNELQNLANNIEQKRNNSLYLSQESFEADLTSLQRKDQEATQWASTRENQIRSEMATKMQQLNDSIDNFIKDYIAKKGYDAVLYKSAGIYFNPALDVTDEVIDGLNARYTPAKK